MATCSNVYYISLQQKFYYSFAEIDTVLSDLKIHFGNMLKKHIKDSKVRQLDIAAALELSASAVSQMLSGRIVPSMKQLDTMTRLLQLDRNVCAELRDCLMRIRSGDEYMRSPLNDFIRSARIRCGLTVKQLAVMTGIPEENLNMLESCLNVQPTPHEAVRLSAIFGCSVNELWQMAPDSTLENSAGEKSDAAGRVVFREERVPYQAAHTTSVKVPVMRFDDLCNFKMNFDKLVDFAWRHMVEVKNGNKLGLVMIKAAGSEFGYSELYNIYLEVAETSQWLEGMMVLCRYQNRWFLGKAEKKKNRVKSLKDGEFFQCGFYWLVKSFLIDSDLYGNNDLWQSDKTSGRN